MGDTDFYGRVGELESLQDAYDSRIAEMTIIYGHRRIGKTALIQKFCEGKPTFFYTAKAWKDPYQLDRFSQAVGTFCGNPQLRYLESVPDSQSEAACRSFEAMAPSKA